MSHTATSSEALHLISDSATLVAASTLHDFLDAKLTNKPFSLPVTPIASPKERENTNFTVSEAVNEVGVNYHVVGIFGGQSSGKSTLLNHVFGTDFMTMDSEGGQQQTTKGAFLNKSKKGSNLFIVDFEGTDGVERGEDQSFERQLSLFALSITDTLIVNMWAKDIGRYNAANMALLRVVFEVNLQLFARNDKDSKPTLLFVFRDYTKKAKLPEDIKVLTGSLEKIWGEINKPEGLDHLELQDMFTLTFCPLSHYELQEEQFRDDAKLLQRRFVDKEDEDYLFNATGDKNLRSIPLEGLPLYLNSCWKAIKDSKDIDIPSQRELLARCRCNELLDAEMEAFNDFCNEQKKKITRKNELIENVTAIVDKMVVEASDRLRKGAKLYSPNVVGEFVDRLQDHLECEGDDLVSTQCSVIAQEILRGLDGDIFTIVDDALKVITHSKLLLNAAAVGGDGGENLHPANEFVKDFWRTLQQGVARVSRKLQETANSDPTSLFGRYTSFVAQDPMCQERSIEIAAGTVVDQVRKRLESMASDCGTSMNKAFEYVLNHNADGTIRFFATSKGLRHSFGPARYAGMLIMACLLYFRLGKPVGSSATLRRDASNHMSGETLFENEDERKFYLDIGKCAEGGVAPSYPTVGEDEEGQDPTAPGVSMIDIKNVMLSPQAISRHFELYQQQCNFTLQIQERSIEASKQNIPIHMWLLLAFFGFNEVYWLVTNPVLLVLAIVLGYVFFKQWMTVQWQKFEETGPAQVVIPMKMAIEKIAPYVEQIERAVASTEGAKKKPAAAAPSTGEKKVEEKKNE